MIGIVHRDDDAEESTELWHATKLRVGRSGMSPNPCMAGHFIATVQIKSFEICFAHPPRRA